MLGEGQAASEQRQVLIKPRRGKVCTCASAASRCKSRRDHYAFSLISNNLSGDLAITGQGPFLRPATFPRQTKPIRELETAPIVRQRFRLECSIIRRNRSDSTFHPLEFAIGNGECARSERTIRGIRFASPRSSASIQAPRDREEISYKILWKRSRCDFFQGSKETRDLRNGRLRQPRVFHLVAT